MCTIIYVQTDNLILQLNSNKVNCIRISCLYVRSHFPGLIAIWNTDIKNSLLIMRMTFYFQNQNLLKENLREVRLTLVRLTLQIKYNQSNTDVYWIILLFYSKRLYIYLDQELPERKVYPRRTARKSKFSLLR